MLYTQDTLKAQIAHLEKREASLSAEEASLPTYGAHRARWLQVSRELRAVRESLKESRENLKGMIEADALYQAEMAKIRSECTPEQWKYIEEMSAKFDEYDRTVLEPERKAREKRAREAERRRDAFEVIDGGRADD